jgi:hypothetical protein
VLFPTGSEQLPDRIPDGRGRLDRLLTDDGNGQRERELPLRASRSGTAAGRSGRHREGTGTDRSSETQRAWRLYAYNNTGGVPFRGGRRLRLQEHIRLSGTGLTSHRGAVVTGRAKRDSSELNQVGFGAGGTITGTAVSGIAYPAAAGRLRDALLGAAVDVAGVQVSGKSCIVYQETQERRLGVVLLPRPGAGRDRRSRLRLPRPGGWAGARRAVRRGACREVMGCFGDVGVIPPHSRGRMSRNRHRGLGAREPAECRCPTAIEDEIGSSRRGRLRSGRRPANSIASNDFGFWTNATRQDADHNWWGHGGPNEAIGNRRKRRRRGWEHRLCS